MATAESSEGRYFAVADIPPNTSPRQVERVYEAMASLDQPIFHRQTAPFMQELPRQLQEHPPAD